MLYQALRTFIKNAISKNGVQVVGGSNPLAPTNKSISYETPSPLAVKYVPYMYRN
jgi:hypothetical protein